MESKKEIKCPKCTCLVTLKENSDINKCNNCQKEFCNINCISCSQPIYFEKIFYDGYIIQCPYISCEASFCLTKCEECSSIIAISNKNKYSQGNKIKCQRCNKYFKKVKCPNFDCPKNIICDQEFKEGQQLECKHNDGIYKFQKVGCWYCGRHCVWNNSKGQYYIEGQMIFCPYKECERMSNKISCKNCSNICIITKGNLDMGKKINCTIKGCETSFNIFFCPYCKKTHYGDGSPIAGKNLTCKDCNKSFCFVNCFFCKQIHFWKNSNKYLPCQTVKCSNEGCRKKTALITCPFCNKVNYFSNGVYNLGQKYACSYRECQKEFIILYCGKCNIAHIKDANLDIKNLYTCENCKNFMPTIQCPKCYKFCCLVNFTKIEIHSIFKCPYEKCGQIFYYNICGFCNRDFNTDNYTSINIKCPFQNCNKIFTYFKCKKCLKDNYIENKENKGMECEELNCTFCNQNNEIINKPDINKFINIMKVNITQGERFDFDNPEEDPYDRKIINSLIQINNYEIPFDKNNTISEENNNHVKLCVICFTEEIKWVLVPCGHKCVCASCGKIIKERAKKCPICKEKIIGVLKEIIDD